MSQLPHSPSGLGSRFSIGRCEFDPRMGHQLGEFSRNGLAAVLKTVAPRKGEGFDSSALRHYGACNRAGARASLLSSAHLLVLASNASRSANSVSYQNLL